MAAGDASLTLQVAIYQRLVADAAVMAIVGPRVFDEVPTGAAKPYVSFGPEQVLISRGQDTDGSDIAVQLDAWSSGPGRIEVKQLAIAIRAALDRAPLDLAGLDAKWGAAQRLVNLEIEQTRYLREQEGRVWHAALIFRAITEPA
jgi:hypothetical protein